MIRFLLKGLLRDRSRSLFPILIVCTGVMLTVFLYSYLQGVMSGFIESMAHLNTGHARVMSRAYAEEADQSPNDLSLVGIDSLLTSLRADQPSMLWTPRIKFGGLLDIPDEKGETRAQGPVMGMAIDLFSPGGPEWRILNIERALVRGRLPRQSGEILIGDEFSSRLGVRLGETATLISSTMYGSMSTVNFTVVGTVRFGVTAMDRSTMLADISDLQNALDMQNAAGEILGFFSDDVYQDETASEITAAFNAKYSNPSDEFSPVMGTLRNQSGLASYFDLIGIFSYAILGIFVLAMSIVLWNAGLMGSLRRYGEISVRLAMGEDKGHIYRTLLWESLMIGIIGSMLGTLIGVAAAYYVQVKGINIGSMMKSSTIMISDVLRAKVTPVSFFIGFFPGLLATLFGSAISGIGIYKRQTAQLFKELEV